MKSKFNKKKSYKSLCQIISPNGMIKSGTVLTGEVWLSVLVYDVGSSFDQMFEEIKNL